jgi:hypothetical protein
MATMFGYRLRTSHCSRPVLANGWIAAQADGQQPHQRWLAGGAQQGP